MWLHITSFLRDAVASIEFVHTVISCMDNPDTLLTNTMDPLSHFAETVLRYY